MLLFLSPYSVTEEEGGGGTNNLFVPGGQTFSPHGGRWETIFYVGCGSGYDDAEMKGPEIPVYFSISLQIRIDFT